MAEDSLTCPSGEDCPHQQAVAASPVQIIYGDDGMARVRVSNAVDDAALADSLIALSEVIRAGGHRDACDDPACSHDAQDHAGG